VEHHIHHHILLLLLLGSGVERQCGGTHIGHHRCVLHHEELRAGRELQGEDGWISLHQQEQAEPMDQRPESGATQG